MVCAALCSAMVFTGIGPVLTPYLENAVVYADENENSGVKKVFTADQLKVAWGDADYELADGQWKLSFAKQYNQVKWTLPESIEMSQVNAVTFQVADQKVPISLKVYNGGDDATFVEAYEKAIEALETTTNSSFRIRKLTPKECYRLMGFSDEDFEKAKAVNSNSQLYKQAGNSIVVNVLEEIYKCLHNAYPNDFTKSMNVMSLFSGIGAFEKALERVDFD